MHQLFEMGICWGKPAKLAHASSTNFYDSRIVDHHSSNDAEKEESFRKKAFSGFLINAIGEMKTDHQQSIYSSNNNLKSFTYNDLKSATRNFRPDSMLGEGGFGYVFKGWIDENTFGPSRPGFGMLVAVKRLKRQSFQGHREWLAEVNYLGQLHHKNLVKLIGYCSESENRLLVYEYMPKGSLEGHLFRKGVQTMPWTTRMKIAIEVARGLSFLHTLDTNIIYRDLKPSNILLDSEFNAKLSDFGLARDGPIGDRTHVSTRIVGTKGYVAPEYLVSGHLTAKSDVYSYGVVLLEILSGSRAIGGDEQVMGAEKTLFDWALPFLSDPRKVLRIMDSRLGGQYVRREAQTAAGLVLKCLHNDPKSRPSMQQVLSVLEHLQVNRRARQ